MRSVILFCSIVIVSCVHAYGADSTPEDMPGFERIFNGETLDGWEGDPVYWRVEDGNLVGEVTPETLLQSNSWIIWQGDEVEDFELKLEYRVSDDGNSGVGYRCSRIPDRPFALRGYQADIDGRDQWTGINYEERGRAFLALRGMKTVVEPGQMPTVTSVFAEPDYLQGFVKKGDWNSYHLIVRGNRMQHFINGVLMSEVIDNDPTNGARKGLLGVQVHVGPPMKIEFRNVLLKRFPCEDSATPAKSPVQEGQQVVRDNKTTMDHLESQAARIRTQEKTAKE